MTAKKLQQQGMELREQGKHSKAVAVLSEAILAAVAADDASTLAGALGDRALCWKHMFLSTTKGTYLELFEVDAELMLKTAQNYGLTELINKANRFLGEVAVEQGDWATAVGRLKAAVDQNPENAEKGDYLCHLGEALYLSGDREGGLAAFKQGLAQLERHREQTDTYLYHVWLSGAYLRLAKVLKEDEPAEAMAYLEKAGEIIKGDKRLLIRKRQWEEAREMMQSRS
jgi:tetratricopeptide (TPR) repeat protein